MRDAFNTSIRRVRSQVHFDQIVNQIKQGDIEGAVRAVGLNPTQFRGFDQTLSMAFEASGNAAATAVPIVYDAEGFRISFDFNMRNRNAEDWLAQRSSTLVTQIIDDQRQMLRETLSWQMSRGANPRTAALDIVGRIGSSGSREGGFIGLTSSQAQWVRNYRDELESNNPLQALERELRDRRFDAAVKRAASSGEAIDADLLDKMVQSYENRALMYRAEAIGRTEAMASLHEAQQQSMEQAVDDGIIKAQDITFIWRTAEDSRVRDAHVVMDGQERGLGEMFEDGDGNQLEFPGDPNAPAETTVNCRCWREPSVDFLAGIE